MSKITIPLLMIFAAIGFIALAKLDRDERGGPQHLWPEDLTRDPSSADVDPAPLKKVPIEMAESLNGEELELLTNRQLANVKLLPLSSESEPVSFLWPSDENDAPSHTELFDLATAERFLSWKSYVDEDIGFFYPDYPGVEVSVIDPTAEIPVFGEEFLTTDPKVYRRYRISAHGDDGTLCVISLASCDAPIDYDDVPRAPYPEVFHRYVASGGGLMRVSFTELGQVRRVEWQGDGIRVALLDWPHLAVHPEVYLRIAASLQLAARSRSTQEQRQLVAKRYGVEGKLGLLNHGVSIAEVVGLAGQPLDRGEHWQYLKRDGSDRVFYQIKIRHDQFFGFPEDWRTVSRDMPGDGSVRWMEEKTDYHAGPAGGIGYNLGNLADADVTRIFDRIFELAPSAGADDFASFSRTLVNLSQHGLRDSRMVEVASSRLSPSGGKASDAALSALVACGCDLSKAAVSDHITRLFESPTVKPETLEHLYTLIAFLGRDFKGSPQLVDRALRHESEAVRELGFKYCTWLPEKFAMPHLEAGLHDQSVEVRRHCAGAFASGMGDPERHPKILKICLAEENDEQVKLHLEAAILRFDQ